MKIKAVFKNCDRITNNYLNNRTKNIRYLLNLKFC